MSIPAGMREVTKREFWAAVKRMEKNVHPRSERLETIWEDQRTRKRWGWVSLGYASPFGAAEIFALAEDA